MSENEYWEAVGFIEQRDGKKRAQRIGRALIKADKVTVYLDAVPVGKWDGSIVLQPKREGGYQRGGGRGGDSGGGEDIPF